MARRPGRHRGGHRCRHGGAQRAPAARGVGYLLAEGGVPVRCRSHHLTDDDLRVIADRAAIERKAVARPDLHVVGS